MTETEGVIKYRLNFELTAPPQNDLKELNVWRSILHGLQLIGQHDERYGGYGFGNLSVRCQQDSEAFIISGSQTGHIPVLNNSHYVQVDACNLQHNEVIAHGAIQPSSEALTHSVLYQSDDRIDCVIHVHDNRLWRYGLTRKWPQTDETIRYGTPQMAAKVAQLLHSGELEHCGTLVMAGHEDGVICFGHSVQQAGQRLIELWVQAHTDSD